MARRLRATYLRGENEPLAEGSAEAKAAFAVTSQVHNVFLRPPAKMAVPSRASRTPQGRSARTRRGAPGATQRRDVIVRRRQSRHWEAGRRGGAPWEWCGAAAGSPRNPSCSTRCASCKGRSVSRRGEGAAVSTCVPFPDPSLFCLCSALSFKAGG